MKKKFFVLVLVSALFFPMVIRASVSSVDLSPVSVNWTNDGLKLVIANNGNSDFNGTFFISLLDLDSNTYVDYYKFQGTVMAGNSINLIVNSLYGSPSHYPNLEIQVDYNNNILEVNENNNTIRTEKTPDLVIKDIYVENDQIKIKYCNGENASLIQTKPTPFAQAFYLKLTTNNITHTGTSNNTDYKFSVPEENYCAISDGYPTSYFNLSGSNSATATIDWQNSVIESNENNNIFSKIITVAEVVEQKPDLTISDIFIQNDRLHIKYCNIGLGPDKDATMTTTHFYIKVSANGYTHDGQSNNSNYVFLVNAAGTCKDAELYPVSYFNLQAGVATQIVAMIDWQNGVAESNENNNTFSKTITIPGSSSNAETKTLDLVIKDIYVENDQIKIKYCNGENASLIQTQPTPFAQTFYIKFSANNITHTGTSNNTNYNLSVPNEGYCAIMDDYLASYFNLLGSNSVTATIDWQNSLEESNENNNIFSKIITVARENSSASSDGNEQNNESVLQLQRRITELEKQVIELENKLTRLDQKFAEKYAGTMFLDVENDGRLWYVDPVSNKRYYFENGESALSIGSELAIGITYDNLQKIPVGIPDKLYNLKDTDGDGLSDNLETALGSDPNKIDSDGDGYNDKQEIVNGYNPVTGQRYVHDKSLVNRLEGRMLLQVAGENSHGEIWYVQDGKRWYGGTQASMFEIMKDRSLGAKADDIRKIAVGEISSNY